MNAEHCDSPLRGGGSLCERPTPMDLSQGCFVPAQATSSAKVVTESHNPGTDPLGSAARKADESSTTHTSAFKPTRRIRGKSAPPSSGPRIRLTAKTRGAAADEVVRTSTTLTRNDGPPAARVNSASAHAWPSVGQHAVLQTDATSGAS